MKPKTKGMNSIIFCWVGSTLAEVGVLEVVEVPETGEDEAVTVGIERAPQAIVEEVIARLTQAGVL